MPGNKKNHRKALQKLRQRSVCKSVVYLRPSIDLGYLEQQKKWLIALSVATGITDASLGEGDAT